MKKLIVAAALFVTPALAQVAPTPEPAPLPAPDIVITAQELTSIENWVQASTLSLKQNDGGSHALIDGTALLQFLAQKETLAKQKRASAAEKVKADATPAAKE